LEQNLIDWSLANLALRPLFARSGVACGMVRNGYREAQTLGVDRWLGMIAAFKLANKLANKACVVVSCGTAITLDLVAQDGEHLGGFIAPGLNLMLDSLTSGTRQIQLSQSMLALELSPGTTTSNAVYSACAAMLTGLIDNGVRQLSKDDLNLEFQMVFTGGDASKLLPFYPLALIVPDLVMDGLGCVLEYPE
jgi:type III pantothenate kinase